MVNNKTTKIIGLKVNIPEPKETIYIDSSVQLIKLLEERYRVGKTGKEYNLVTKYTNAIIKAIFKPSGNGKKINYPILIKFPYVRHQWIKAAVQYKQYGKVEENNGEILIESNGCNKEMETPEERCNNR